jgi:hypothetical protein
VICQMTPQSETWANLEKFLVIWSDDNVLRNLSVLGLLLVVGGEKNCAMLLH